MELEGVISVLEEGEGPPQMTSRKTYLTARRASHSLSHLLLLLRSMDIPGMSPRMADQPTSTPAILRSNGPTNPCFATVGRRWASSLSKNAPAATKKESAGCRPHRTPSRGGAHMLGSVTMPTCCPEPTTTFLLTTKPSEWFIRRAPRVRNPAPLFWKFSPGSTTVSST